MRMIAATSAIEFVSTATETEALLLEANLIKRLRPRFNVLMRDDKSFPYILITAGETPPMIMKHRGARSRPGEYYGPFASAQSVHRTITALERAFLIRSCSDPVYESRTRPCLLHQIKRCSAPCTGEISHEGYAELVREATLFLTGKSRAVKEELAGEMEKASATLDFERAAVYRDRLAAEPAERIGRGIRACKAAAPRRGLRQQPHPGLECRRCDDRRGTGGLSQEPVPQVQHQVGEPGPGR